MLLRPQVQELEQRIEAVRLNPLLVYVNLYVHEYVVLVYVHLYVHEYVVYVHLYVYEYVFIRTCMYTLKKTSMAGAGAGAAD